MSPIIPKRPLAWLLTAGGIFLYLQLFILPATPIHYSGDAHVFMLEGQRILDGQLIYRDFFEFLPAGIVVFYAVLFKVLGARAWCPNLVVLLLGMTVAWVSMIISKRLLRRGAVFLPAVMFLVLAFRNSLDGTHHWFSVLAVLGAVAVTLTDRSTARLAVAGVLCGIASDFTTTRGFLAVIGFSAFLLWEARQKKEGWRHLLKREAILVGTFLAPVVLFNAYFVWKAGLRTFLDCTVTFVVKYYPAEAEWNTIRIYMTDLPRLHPWYRLPGLGVWLFIYLLQPLIYLLFLARYRRQRRATPDEPWKGLMLVNSLGLSLVASTAPAPNWTRLCAVSVPALIMFVWFVQSSARFSRVLMGSLWIVTLILAVGETAERQMRWKAILDVPTGRTAFLEPIEADKVRWLLEHTRPSDYFLNAAGPPDLYFPLSLRDPAKVPYLTNSDFVRPEQVQDAIAGLEKWSVKYVLWPFSLDLPKPFATHDNLAPLRRYMRQHYHEVKEFGDLDQVWERN